MGLVITLCGISALFKPDWMKKFIVFISKGKLVYLAAGLKILMGIVFLIFATQCKWTGFIIAVGILSVVGATVFCLIPYIKITVYLTWWKNRPMWLYRLWGLTAVVFGIALMYGGFPQTLQ
jgi:hypothetical protein